MRNEAGPAFVRRRRAAGICAVIFAAAVGCTQDASGRWTIGQNANRAADPGTHSNIVRVNKFFSSDPWLSFHPDGTRKIDGVRFTLYLESADKARGVFGTGTIIVTMYRLDRDALGRELATQIHEWELTPQEAYPWRAKQETMFGWGYGLRLGWDPKLQVAGRDVAFVVRYVRDDGRVVTSTRQVLRVPGSADVRPSQAVS